MKSALLHKRAFTGYPNEVELLEAGGDRLFEVDSLRQPGQRMLCALAEDGTKDYPVYDPDKKKVKWQSDDRFGKKFKSEVKKHMEAEVEKAETPKEEEEATNDPALRKAAKMGKCVKCHEERSLNRDRVCHQCEQEERDNEKTASGKNPWIRLAASTECECGTTEATCHECGYRTSLSNPMSSACPKCSSPLACVGCQRQISDDGLGVVDEDGTEKPFLTTGMPAHRTIPYQYTPSGRRGSAVPTVSVHELKGLIEEIRGAGFDESFAPTHVLIATAKKLGANDLKDAARHYLATLHRMAQYRAPGALGEPTVPRRTQRAHDAAWKQVEAAYVHFVR